MLLTIISAVIAFSVLIVFHEFGHFIVAKRSGIKVEEFSLGLGPKIIGITKGDTIYKLSLIPFGGYVKLAGMDPKETKGEPYEFNSKRATIRIAVILAGPAFNFILAFIIFTITNSIIGLPTLPTTTIKSIENCDSTTVLQSGDQILAINGEETHIWNDVLEGLANKDSSKCLIKREDAEFELTLPKSISSELVPLILPIIGKVAKDGPAYQAGIQDGDLITKLITTEILDKDTVIDTFEITEWDNITSIIHANPEKEVSIEWLRNENYMEAKVIPDKEQALIDDEVKDVGMIKVIMKMNREPIGISAFKFGFLQTVDTFILTLSFFKKLFLREVSTKNLGGPIAIVKFAGESAKWGIESFLMLVAFLSINLLILNLLPFPPLDGGQILLILIEKIRRKPISERTIAIVQNIGFVLLIALMLYVTTNDIVRLIK